ncbi:MAG: PadR family transcriptional regulator [Thermoanaerobaculia bacterium]|nr:PadR family transcriptional regulator [Thermoanaerobaculia bacterium]
MLAIARLGDEAYGGAIRREIEEHTGREVAIGALYATLDRLADKSLLEFRVDDAGPARPGRLRKYCAMTAAGEQALRHSTEMLRRMIDGAFAFLASPAGPKRSLAPVRTRRPQASR